MLSIRGTKPRPISRPAVQYFQERHALFIERFAAPCANLLDHFDCVFDILLEYTNVLGSVKVPFGLCWAVHRSAVWYAR